MHIQLRLTEPTARCDFVFRRRG